MTTATNLGRSAAALVAAVAVVLGTPGTAPALPVAPAAPGGGAAVSEVAPATVVDPTRAVGPGVYLVTLVERPAASYTGGVPGYPATKPRPGDRLDRTRPTVRSYAQRLVERQDEVLSRVGDPEVLYRFTTAVNGFAARLSSHQVKALRGTQGVALVEKSTHQKLDTVDSPGFLGLEAAWRESGGPERAGKGTVIGVIDSGIWPENPSFAGLPGTGRRPEGFHGACQRGEQWDTGDCNDKVVAARYFVKAFGRQNLAKSEYLSPRDGSGHGSHTASTAAGNADVAVRIEDQDFGATSGMAPAARIAAYKACWAAPNPDDDGCATADTVAAIDQAVSDGVDVINYSISGSPDTLADTVELAFLNASAGGVFVATSAGNSGPAAGTVAHVSPWVTTVAASSHHLFQGSVSLGGDEPGPYVGAMVSDREVPSTGLVLSADAAVEGARREEAQICEIGSLDATLVQDKIVVCDRGTTARVDKSEAVAQAGGAGMVLANVTPDDVEADFHSVPTVHVDTAAAETIKHYIREAVDAGEQPTASISPTGTDDTAVPQIAEFSSRGPATAVGGDLVKPDLAAPGVSVVAAVAPPASSGRLWDLYSGTSTSAPHIAGLAAFVMSQKPTWSPAAVKSAMMTTADDVEGTAGRLAQGAGNVDPGEFLDPGLVFDADTQDYLDFLAAQGYRHADGSPVSQNPRPAGDLNLPSIAVGDLTGSRTVTRRVTNLSDRTESFAPAVTGLDGVDATVRPRVLTLSPGESARFTVRFETTPDAAFGHYTAGSLVWTGLERQVRIPIVVRPEQVDAPEELTGTGSSGALTVNGTSGTDKEIELSSEGLVFAMPTGVTLVPGEFDPARPEADTDTFAVPVRLDPGVDVARFQMDAHNAADDMDMFVYRDDELVARSATASADETVTLVEPEPGDYTVYVSSYAAANGSTTTGQFYSWVVGQTDPGNLRLTPETIRTGTGERFSYRASWEGLGPYRWFGVIRYGGTAHRTLVTVQ